MKIYIYIFTNIQQNFSKILIIKLQRLQKKVLDPIAEADRYIRIQKLLKIELFGSYVETSAANFLIDLVNPQKGRSKNAEVSSDAAFRHDRLDQRTSLPQER